MVFLAIIALGLGVIATYVTRVLAVNPANPHHVVGKIALHDLLEARARHLEDETRRERLLPFEYLRPPWLRPGRAVVRNQAP